MKSTTSTAPSVGRVTRLSIIAAAIAIASLSGTSADVLTTSAALRSRVLIATTANGTVRKVRSGSSTATSVSWRSSTPGRGSY